jgi:hypothetical protein
MLYPWPEFSCSWTVLWASVWDGGSRRTLAISPILATRSLGDHLLHLFILQ